MCIDKLKEGWGGLVLCAKNDEAELWEKYCIETGRDSDRITFGKNTKLSNGEDIVFNPIDYEMRRDGEGAGETTNLTNIFMNIYRMGNRVSGDTDIKEERYWDSALKRCLNRVIELLKLAGEDLSYSNMVKVISSSNSIERDTFLDAKISVERGEDIEGILSSSMFCLKCLLDAYYRLEEEYGDEKPYEIQNAFDMVEDYFTKAMPNMDDKTKSIVSESFLGLAEPFLSGILSKHFARKTNISPEWTYEQNKIIILDFPVKEFLEAGIIAQTVFKLMFQQAVERRDINIYPMPVFLWCDEAQYFINPYDQVFLTTARGSRAATVFLSQNISNYFSVMGSGSNTEAKVHSLMGNLCTKIFHANSDTKTNEYASGLIGKTRQNLGSSNEQYSYGSLKNSFTDGSSEQMLPQIEPHKFTTLLTGGIENNRIVESILAINGKTWSNGKNYLKVRFTQELKK